MAFTTILRRVASSSTALRSAVVRTQQRSYSSSSAVFSPIRRRCTLSQQRKTFVPALHFSALAKKQNSDTLLLKVIEAEIECAKETDDHDRVEPTPAGFPFKIIDRPGEQTVTLEREYQGEVIKVQVHMPDLVTGNEGEEDKGSGDDNEGENSAQSSIPLVVSVTKQNGPCLEFSVMAYADEISIDSLSVKQPDASEEQIAYEGPDFGDLDENLQKAFHKYLEIRGIKPSTTNFLHEYMINKDSREYLIWLKNLKNFVEN